MWPVVAPLDNTDRENCSHHRKIYWIVLAYKKGKVLLYKQATVPAVLPMQQAIKFMHTISSHLPQYYYQMPVCMLGC